MISVRVISLARSTARRVAMSAQLTALPGLDWGFFDACAALPAGLHHHPGHAQRAIRRDLTAGELGCFASHWCLWRHHAGAPAGDWLVVLEDDLLLDPGFFAALPHIVASLPPDLDYLRLHAKVPAPARVIGRAGGRHLVRYRGIAFGTQAYLLRPAAAAKFAAITRIERPVDDEIDRYWVHKVANIGLFPFPVVETLQPSTIEATRRSLAPPAWHEWGWQARRARDRLRRAAANLRLDLGWRL